jgi:hypothetical protein
MTNTEQKPTEEVTKANEEIQKVLEKHKVDIMPTLDFPNYKVYPDDLQLAINVISKHNPKFGIVLQPKAK